MSINILQGFQWYYQYLFHSYIFNKKMDTRRRDVITRRFAIWVAGESYGEAGVFFRGAGGTGHRTLDLILVKIRVVFGIKLKSGI